MRNEMDVTITHFLALAAVFCVHFNSEVSTMFPNSLIQLWQQPRIAVVSPSTWDFRFRLQDNFIFHFEFQIVYYYIICPPHCIIFVRWSGELYENKEWNSRKADNNKNVFEDQVKRDLRALWEISHWSCIAEKENKQILEYLRLLLSFSSAALRKSCRSTLSFCAGYPIVVICYVNFQIFPLVNRLSDAEHFFLDRSNNCTITKWIHPTRREQSQL